MKQESFKEMYNMIKLDNSQKERILGSLAEEAVKDRKKIRIKSRFHMPALATICICITLIASVPVIAANTDIVSRIMQAFNLLSIDRPEITDKQKEIYLKYGNVLDSEIKLESGTLKLDAVICDKNYICIPFSVINSDNTSKKRVDNENIRFYLESSKNNRWMGMFTVFSNEMQENESLNGCYLLEVDEEINPKDKMFVKRAEKWDDDNDDLISEFSIEKIAKSHNIPVDRELVEQKDMNPIYSMEISPLSLRIEGNNSAKNTKKGHRADLYFYDITVELKDGTVVKQADTGSWSSKSENHDYVKTILFAAPIDLKDVAGVRIKGVDEELWFPVEAL